MGVWDLEILALEAFLYFCPVRDLDLFELAIDSLCHTQTPECLNFS